MTMQQTALNFTSSDVEAGFRLASLELYNWGTFHQKVWSIEPGSHNSLLTGDIGSGKSTIVDAVLTLLVPQQKLVYNKAAGAESRERTLASYVRGEYKSERDDLSGGARAVALRDESHYTVLLARFSNDGYGQEITIAQVFHLKKGKTVPDRFFVVAEQGLSIREHFSGFGHDFNGLRKQLRLIDRLTIFSSFKEYSIRFRHLLGIQNSQALNLFYQTVSMKSVGNLTEFVRLHMLEAGDVQERLNELRSNFDNLSRAYESVRKARKKIEELRPITADLKKLKTINLELESLRTCRRELYGYFQFLRIALLDARISKLQRIIVSLKSRQAGLSREIEEIRNDELDVRKAIDEHGGRRIEELTREIGRLNNEIKQTRKVFIRVNELASGLRLGQVKDREGFFRIWADGKELLSSFDQELKKIDLLRVDIGVDIRNLDEQINGFVSEITSLKKRTTNIPARTLAIRSGMAELLKINESEIPFVGELVQVDKKEQQWEGSIERVLHNFGLSLLVDNDLYDRISRYVDKTNLRGRLVYFRVRASQAKVHRDSDSRLLYNKIRIKPASSFYKWLEDEMVSRFSYLCCETMEDFQRSPKGLTLQGQIKSGGRRHEKDDRTDINDRSRFILGWSNREKIKALSRQKAELEKQGQKLAVRAAELEKKQQQLGEKRDNCLDLLRVDGYEPLDWQTPASRQANLQEELRVLEQKSDILMSLRDKLELIRSQIREKEQSKIETAGELGGIRQELSVHEKDLSEIEEYRDFKKREGAEQEKIIVRLEKFTGEVLQGKRLDLRTLDKDQSRVREYIQQHLDKMEKQRKNRENAIIRMMGEFRNRWPAESSELDVSPEAGTGYASMLETLSREDLPRHEQRFKELLNEGTINSIALFQGQLERECDDIENRIEAINTSLCGTEYSAGTYIELKAERSQDIELRSFREELKQCLGHSLDDDDLYNEQRFMRVRNLITRFNGREGMAELDRRWTAKVTDVRNWYVFSAVERWQEDGSEKEYYAGSAGKSGGQKEKLAYTILASALAYQFGLEWGAVKSRSFRFVVIDEAFGRGSDESTRYGLNLFKRLNLQLLIVTPLQKIHVIEDYIRSVHFIHNDEGRDSQVRNLSIEEYYREKERRG